MQESSMTYWPDRSSSGNQTASAAIIFPFVWRAKEAESTVCDEFIADRHGTAGPWWDSRSPSSRCSSWSGCSQPSGSL
jgi:hypothetical protein